MKQLSDTVNKLLKQDSSPRVAEPYYSAEYSARHLHYPRSGYYQQMIPHYYNSYLAPPPSTYHPAAISPTHSSSEQSFSDCSLQKSTTNTSPKESSFGDQVHSSIPLDSDIEDEVPPLPPPLCILKDQQESEFEEIQSTQAGGPQKKNQNPLSLPISKDQEEREFEETRFPLQSTQAGGPKKNKKKVKDKIIYPVTEVFNNTFLSKCLAESVSRPNFSLNLVSKFFSEEVRLTSNVSGKGKNQLDKDIVSAIKVASFRMWPLKSTENEAAAWRECIKAIDAGGRGLRRNIITKEN